MNEYWFKPRRYGLGATPSSWEGWTLILVYLGAVVALGLRFERNGGAQAPQFLIAVALLTAALVFISWRKTKGEWRWRWGERD